MLRQQGLSLSKSPTFKCACVGLGVDYKFPLSGWIYLNGEGTHIGLYLEPPNYYHCS